MFRQGGEEALAAKLGPEGHRSVCYRCMKPEVTCVCEALPRIDNRTSVYILQHPRERLHAVGTVRLAALALKNAQVAVAWDANQREDAPPPFLPAGAGLLYPSPEARDLAQVAPADRPRHLVVIDGTWHTARTLYRDKRWLQALPQYKLSPEGPSRYRIRREPERSYVSSVEAIVEALRLLEPDTAGLDGLLEAFDRMIDVQVSFERKGRAPRARDRRPAAYRRLPRALVEDFDRLVVAYGESARATPGSPRALVQCAAVCLRSGETFERLIRAPFGRPSDAHLLHMGLEASDFEAAVDPTSFRTDFRAFLGRSGPDAILATWNESTLELLAESLGVRLQSTALKSAYRNVEHASFGSLDAVAVAERLYAPPYPFGGRARDRTARAVAIARFLNGLADGPARA